MVLLTCWVAMVMESLLFIFVLLNWKGGLWLARDKSEYVNVAKAFISLNYAVAIVNYRLSTGNNYNENKIKHATHTEDVAKAIEFLINNGNKYNYSNENLVLIGHSCGAHMAGILTANCKFYFGDN